MTGYPLEALKYVQLHTNFDIDDDTINYNRNTQLIVDWAPNYNEGTITHDVAFDKQIARKHFMKAERIPPAAIILIYGLTIVLLICLMTSFKSK